MSVERAIDFRALGRFAVGSGGLHLPFLHALGCQAALEWETIFCYHGTKNLCYIFRPLFIFSSSVLRFRITSSLGLDSEIGLAVISPGVIVKNWRNTTILVRRVQRRNRSHWELVYGLR